MAKVLITPRSFGKYSDEATRMIKDANIEIVLNPTGKILLEDEMISLLKDVDGVIIGIDPLNAKIMRSADKLVAIAKYGVGTDNIDLDYTKAAGIDVTITKNANSNAVADFAFTLMLSVARRVVETDIACRKKDWSKKISLDVYGKKIGILGLGSIGKGVALRAKGFNMDVYAYDVYQDEAFAQEHGITFTDIATILSTCDFITVHLPLIPETTNLINKTSLATMKKTAIIVNTARGGIINEDDLYTALKNKSIYGAGIDVFAQEPASDSKLLELSNVIVGSHSSASTEGAVDAMSRMAAENIIQSLKQKGRL
jgi:D-3-phosphoglycerate dehydrogenase